MIIHDCELEVLYCIVVPLQSPESSLQIVQRALVLLTNHLESFRKRYAYHLRQWQLDGRSIGSHHCSLQDKHSQPIHIIIQPATTADKVLIQPAPVEHWLQVTMPSHCNWTEELLIIIIKCYCWYCCHFAWSLWEFSKAIWWILTQNQLAANPLAKPTELAVSLPVGCYCLHPVWVFTVVTQSKGWPRIDLLLFPFIAVDGNISVRAELGWCVLRFCKV